MAKPFLNINLASEFKEGNENYSICINLNTNYEIIDWSFHQQS